MLHDALRSGPVWALGTMSGTSLDGVDAAMVLTDGDRIFDCGSTAYRPYSEAERKVLRAALGRWEGFGAAEAAVEAAHLEVLCGMGDAVVIGFHGQTTAHDPANRRTCQIGNGERLADALGRPVVWDFRSADVAAGGQGAPLAPFFHHSAMRTVGRVDPVAILNLGGVGNLSWVDPGIEDPAEPGACLAFDTGPANAPLDDLMRSRQGLERDEGGALAAQGNADPLPLARLAADPYFEKRPPKSLDRDAFGWLGNAVDHLSDADAAATLARAVAECVAVGLGHCPARPVEILVTGGGRRNEAMMGLLAGLTGCAVRPVEAVGLDGDMLEAQAFAYLAVRVLRGLPISAPGTTGVSSPMVGGRISQPNVGAWDRSRA